MSVRLLTDEEIQEYLDGNLDYRRQMQIERLVEASAHNRQLLESYQGLYGTLKTEEVFVSKPNPSTAPLDQLVVTHHRRSLYGVLTAMALVAMAAAAVFAISLVIDFQAIAARLVGLLVIDSGISLSGILAGLTDPLSAIGAEHQRTVLFAIGAGLVLLVYRWLDAIIIQSRLRRLTR